MSKQYKDKDDKVNDSRAEPETEPEVVPDEIEPAPVDKNVQAVKSGPILGHDTLYGLPRKSSGF